MPISFRSPEAFARTVGFGHGTPEANHLPFHPDTCTMLSQSPTP
ncbi:hypothetical protein ACFCV9_22075 [Streptomyces sp. NPDC056367]